MLSYTQPIIHRRVTFWLAIEHGRAIVEINGVKRRQPLLLNSHLKQTRTHVVMRYVCYYVLNSWLIIKTYIVPTTPVPFMLFQLYSRLILLLLRCSCSTITLQKTEVNAWWKVPAKRFKFYICIPKPKVAFSNFHFVLLYFFPNECSGLC